MTELERDRRRVGASFLVIAALAPVLALLPPDGDTTPVAVVAYLSIVAAAALTTRKWWPRAALLSGPAGMFYVLAVALLRHAEGGASSGLTPLFLLPLFWASLVGARWSVAFVVSAMALALALPIVLAGAPAYPVTEWRRLAVWLAVAPVVGAATIQLRRRTEQARAAADELARTDALTNCLNRRGLEEVATRELARARRTGTPVTVALLDLDRFKVFNDTHGHDAGDDLLRDAGAAWTAAVRDTDVVARWGGEEFVVLLPDTAPSVAIEVLERLRARTPHGQTCSMGVAAVAADDALADAVSRADEALYRAKETGRDRIVVAS